MTTDNSARLEALGRERLNAVYQRDEWAARVAQIDAEILSLAEPGDTIDVGGEPAYIISHGAHRWDEKRARAWAAEQGYEVAASGRIPKAIMADYLNANGRDG